VGKSFGKNISFSNKIKGCGSTKHTRIIKKKMCERFIGSTLKKEKGGGLFRFHLKSCFSFQTFFWEKKSWEGEKRDLNSN